jgi:hypothetical protein
LISFESLLSALISSFFHLPKKFSIVCDYEVDDADDEDASRLLFLSSETTIVRCIQDESAQNAISKLRDKWLGYPLPVSKMPTVPPSAPFAPPTTTLSNPNTSESTPSSTITQSPGSASIDPPSRGNSFTELCHSPSSSPPSSSPPMIEKPTKETLQQVFGSKRELLEKWYMGFALIAMLKSPDKDLKVGAILCVPSSPATVRWLRKGKVGGGGTGKGSSREGKRRRKGQEEEEEEKEDEEEEEEVEDHPFEIVSLGYNGQPRNSQKNQFPMETAKVCGRNRFVPCLCSSCDTTRPYLASSSS